MTGLSVTGGDPLIILAAKGGDEFGNRLQAIQDASASATAAFQALNLGNDAAAAWERANEAQKAVDARLANLETECAGIREDAQRQADATRAEAGVTLDAAKAEAQRILGDAQSKADAILSQANEELSAATQARATADAEFQAASAKAAAADAALAAAEAAKADAEAARAAAEDLVGRIHAAIQGA